MRTLSKTLLGAAFLSAMVGGASAQPARPPAAKAPPAAAAPAGPVSDVRCLMDMFILAQQQQQQQKQTGQVGVYFFAGRISARGGGQDLPTAMKAQVASLQPQAVQSELPRCGAILQAPMRNVEAGFNALRPPGAPPPAAGAPPAGPSVAPPPAAPAPKQP